MFYVYPNFKTKKAFKAAVAAGTPTDIVPTEMYDVPVTNGTVAVGGPHYPAPHKWYATVTMKDGKAVKVS